jgi:hypothetical protein
VIERLRFQTTEARLVCAVTAPSSNAPGALGAVALACFAAAPALVYVCPDTSSVLVATQVVAATALAAGGAAALGGSSLLSSLQK